MNAHAKLSVELAKWDWLKPHLQAEQFDAVALMSALESETDLKECLVEIAESALEDKMTAEVIRQRIKQLQERCSRIETREEKKRRVIAAAMQHADVQSITGEALTLSMRRGGRDLVVMDAEKIPAEYYTPQPPKLDKRKLRDALDQGAQVDGAQLDNGSYSVTIRTA